MILPASGDRLQTETWQRWQGSPRSTGSARIHHCGVALRKASRNERRSVIDRSKAVPSPAPRERTGYLPKLTACLGCRIPQERVSRMWLRPGRRLKRERPRDLGVKFNRYRNRVEPGVSYFLFGLGGGGSWKPGKAVGGRSGRRFVFTPVIVRCFLLGILIWIYVRGL